MNIRTIAAHRFFYVPATLAVVTIGWNLYVDANNGGMVSGQAPANATIAFYERDLTSSFVERRRVQADADGNFRITGNRSHMIQLEAIAPDGTHSTRRTIRLWFRSQNVRLDSPLTMNPPR
jgi:hypothetical protein